MSGSRGRPVPSRDSAAQRLPLRAQLPLLDRLIDEAPEQLHDAPISTGEAMSILRRSVRGDIEALLNSRRRWRSWQAALQGAFGFPAQLRYSGLYRGQISRYQRARRVAARNRGHHSPVRAAFPLGSGQAQFAGRSPGRYIAPENRGCAARRTSPRTDRLRYSG